MSHSLLDEALVKRVLGRNNGSLSGVTIRSRMNPIDGLISSWQGLFLFQVYPLALFSALALYSLRLLRQTLLRDAPTGKLVRLVILSNVVIMSALVILFSIGGGAHGLLLPDWTRRWKTFNVTALGGSSAAVDLLIAMLIDKAIRQRPPHSPPSLTGLACFASLVTLDLA